MNDHALLRHENSVDRYIDDYLTSEKLTINSGGSEGYSNNEQTKVLNEKYCKNKADELNIKLYFHLL
ncbi:MAG: hypothetical protein OCD00_08345 [Colwellia sp.]